MESVLGFIVLIAVVAVIAVVAFGIYKFMNPKLKQEKPSEDQFLQEELDRILKPVDDEETAKQISDYKDEED